MSSVGALTSPIGFVCIVIALTLLAPVRRSCRAHAAVSCGGSSLPTPHAASACSARPMENPGPWTRHRMRNLHTTKRRLSMGHTARRHACCRAVTTPASQLSRAPSATRGRRLGGYLSTLV